MANCTDFDVDGAYVPESAVLDGDSRKFEYTTSTIHVTIRECFN